MQQMLHSRNNADELFEVADTKDEAPALAIEFPSSLPIDAFFSSNNECGTRIAIIVITLIHFNRVSRYNGIFDLAVPVSKFFS